MHSISALQMASLRNYGTMIRPLRGIAADGRRVNLPNGWTTRLVSDFTPKWMAYPCPFSIANLLSGEKTCLDEWFGLKASIENVPATYDLWMLG